MENNAKYRRRFAYIWPSLLQRVPSKTIKQVYSYYTLGYDKQRPGLVKRNKPNISAVQVYMMGPRWQDRTSMSISDKVIWALMEDAQWKQKNSWWRRMLGAAKWVWEEW